jgi:hypothetical protein
MNSRKLWRLFANSTNPPYAPMISHALPGAKAVIKARRQPPPFTGAFLQHWLDVCREDWMRELDRILDDEQLVALAYEAFPTSSPQPQPRPAGNARRSRAALAGAQTYF